MNSLSQGVRGAPLRGYRRRKPYLDLNAPPNEIRDQEGTSNQGAQSSQQGHSAPSATIDVEALDDDVVESSARAFAEAKNNAQRVRGTGKTVVVDVDSGRTTRLTHINRYKRKRVSSSQTIINCDFYINLESSSNSMRADAQVSQQPARPPPPKEPTFSCPICMGPLVEETSTKCGHIFCKQCIKKAISSQAKCPTCRKRVTARELIRVFLPATG